MLRSASLLVVAVAATSACHKSEPAPPEPAAGAAEPPASAPPAPEVSTRAYHAALRVAPCKAGQPCTATVELDAAGEYHVNEQFPYKFKTCEPTATVRYTKPQYGREDGRFEVKRARIPVGFVADKPGETKVCGVFSLSVCSAANCLMERQALETTIRVE